MASPQLEVFFIYDSSGNPLTGQSPTFATYKDDTGSNISQPTISEIGGGAYGFTITYPTNKGVIYIVDCGSGNFPRYQSKYSRPEDWYVDFLLDLHDETIGKWEIFTTGPDANRLVLYREDGTTVLKKFNLQDAAGSATTTNPFKRIPV